MHFLNGLKTTMVQCVLQFLRVHSFGTIRNRNSLLGIDGDQTFFEVMRPIRFRNERNAIPFILLQSSRMIRNKRNTVYSE